MRIWLRSAKNVWANDAGVSELLGLSGGDLPLQLLPQALTLLVITDIRPQNSAAPALFNDLLQGPRNDVENGIARGPS